MSSKRALCSMMSLKKSLQDWSFSAPKLTSLPLDENEEKRIRSHILGAIFSKVEPTPFKTDLKLVAYSEDALKNILDFDPEVTETLEFVEWVAGSRVLPGSVPMAHRYGGHQFGYWANQLGDGRAILLGEYLNNKGERWELQLKGSGPTPYSRFADGRAVLRSSVREFLCSEAMHYLGVPTSRAATLVVSDDPIPRDMFYDGRVKNERGAVVLRLAPSWFRFGSFEILKMNEEFDELKQLADFVLANSFPHIVETGEDGYIAMFAEVVESTAKMIAKWSSVGFTHGVMNTDNMSLLSITIDYGPFGFVDAYDPHFIPNHSDDMGRYDLENQVNIGLWNLDKFAKALKPLISEKGLPQMEKILEGYGSIYQMVLLDLYRAKLGLKTKKEEDEELIAVLLDTMERIEADFTQTFRDLSEISLEDLSSENIPDVAWGLKSCQKSKKIKEFIKIYVARVQEEGGTDEERLPRMQAVNPRYILRNWIAQAAIEKAENDDFSEVQFLMEIFKNPYKVNQEAEKKGYASPVPKWGKKICLSCSS